jgi:hypothetical protein
MSIKGARGASVSGSKKAISADEGGVFEPRVPITSRMRRHEGPGCQDEMKLVGETSTSRARVSGGSAGGASVQVNK